MRSLPASEEVQAAVAERLCSALSAPGQISSTAQPSRHKYAVQTLGDPWLIIIVDRPPFFRISNHLRRCIFVVGLVGEQLQVLSLNFKV